MPNNSVTTKQQWTKAALNDPKYFSVVGSGVEAWVGKKNFLSTKSVQGTKIVAVEGEIDYLNRPSRANMQPKLGRVAFAKMKDTFKVLVADEVLSKEYILSTGFALIDPLIDSNYLYQYFQSEAFNTQKNRYCEGSTQQAISQSDFANIEILFPVNRDEQKRVAEILEFIDQTIEQTDALIKKYERVRAGMMQDLFLFGIDSDGQIRSNQTHKFKTSPVGSIPIDWEVKKLNTLSNVIDSLHSTPSFSQAGVPMVRVTDIKEGNLNLQSALLVSPETYKAYSAKYTPKKGDILMSRVGSYGVVSFVNTNEEFCIGQNTVVINPKINNHFLYYRLTCRDIKTQIEDGLVGSSQKTLSLKNIRNLLVAYPTDETEQARITSAIQAIDEQILSESVYFEKITAFKKGLMYDLLTGSVRTIEK